MLKRILPFIFPLAAVLAFGAPAQAKDKLTFEQTPPKVQETIRQHVQNGKITEIEREQEKGKPAVFEVEYKAADGKSHEIKVREDGQLLKKEKD
jgi:uncharacterized membrane protein YkoI